MIRVVKYTIAIVLTLIVLLLLWQFSVAILLFLLSLAVAAALRPLLSGITGRNIPKRFALGIVYVLLIVTILGSLLLISPPLLDELQRATDDFLTNYNHAKAVWPQQGSLFQQAFAEELPPSAQLFQAVTGAGGMSVVRGVFGIAQNFFTILGQIAIVIVLSLYWSADQFRFERLGLSLLPEEHHPKALQIWRSIEHGVGEYLRSEMVQSVMAGLLLWLGYSVLGMPYPVLLALWGGAARLIPWFGALIAVLPVMFIGIGISSTVGILATIYAIAIFLLMKLVIEPRFFPRYKYSSLLIVLFVIALAEMYGLTGVVLAPPLAVAVQILFQHLYPVLVPTSSSESEQVADIRRRLLALRRRLGHSRSREGIRLIDRLQRLVKQTADTLQEY